MTGLRSPLQPFFDQAGVLLMDGGLATALEAAGHSLQDDLWSARLLMEDPLAIRSVHEAYLQAGADCILTASYQATLEGFRRRGVSEAHGEDLLRLSVQLALDARRDWLLSAERESSPGQKVRRLRPVVAASIGPYGASLADGSEYHGVYGLSDAALGDFHERRWKLLAASPADLLACETIPSRQEVRVLLELLRLSPDVYAWISVTCRDGTQLRDGAPLREVFADVDRLENLAAVGVNCTAPRYIPSCIREIRHVTQKPILVYPNSGELFDEKSRAWVAGDAAPDWGEASVRWRALGASAVGGCCRVGPAEIRHMREALFPHGS